MDDLRFYVNLIAFQSYQDYGVWLGDGDYERLYVMEH